MILLSENFLLNSYLDLYNPIKNLFSTLGLSGLPCDDLFNGDRTDLTLKSVSALSENSFARMSEAEVRKYMAVEKSSRPGNTD